MTTNLTPEVKRVADAILSRIVSGAYPRGLRLPPETALSAELACGRSTLREALRHIADLGLVRSRRGSGVLVLDFKRNGTPALMPTYLQSGAFDTPPATLAREMLRMRAVMAAEAVRLAALYARPEALAEAREILRAGPALENDPGEHALNELAFYRALVMASRIWPAAWMLNMFWTPMREINATFAPVIGPVPPGIQATMARIFSLIENGDAAGAVEAVQRWFESVDQRLVEGLESLFGHSGEATAADSS